MDVEYENSEREPGRSPLRKKLAQETVLDKKYFDDKFEKLKDEMNKKLDDFSRTKDAQNFRTEGTQTRSGDTIPKVNDMDQYKHAMDDYELRRKLAKVARTEAELQEQLPHLKPQYSSEGAKEIGESDGLYCTKCLPEENQDVTIPNQTSAARFTLRQNEGEEKERTVAGREKMDKKFSNMKVSVIRHEESKSHKDNVEKQPRKELEDILPATDKEKPAAMACGRSAYQAIRSQQSQQSYIESIANKAADGIDVGDINHSEAFAKKFTTALHTVIKDKLKEVISEPLPATGLPAPIAVVADKATFGRNTYLITGITAPLQGKMTTAVIDVGVVPDHTGAGLAQQQIHSLKEFVKELPFRLIGASYDGAFHHDNVPRHIIENLHKEHYDNVVELERKLLDVELMKTRIEKEEKGFRVIPQTSDEERNLHERKTKIMENFTLVESDLTEARRVTEAIREWNTWTWDPAHLIELAEADMKKSAEGKFPKQVEKIVTEVQNEVRFGKSYFQLQEEMRREDKIPRAVTAFSNTRFAEYEGGVLKNVINNYPGLLNVLNNKQHQQQTK